MVFDPETGRVLQAQVFVAVLGASSYTFARASFSQALPDWIEGQAQALAFFKGPVTKEDKAELERVRRNIRDSESELAYLREEFAKEPGSPRWNEEIESEEYSLALLRWNERLLTGTDPEDLIQPVRPPSVERRMAKHKDRLEEWRRNRPG